MLSSIYAKRFANSYELELSTSHRVVLGEYPLDTQIELAPSFDECASFI